MKTKVLFVSLFAVFALSSCDKIKDWYDETNTIESHSESVASSYYGRSTLNGVTVYDTILTNPTADIFRLLFAVESQNVNSVSLINERNGISNEIALPYDTIIEYSGPLFHDTIEYLVSWTSGSLHNKIHYSFYINRANDITNWHRDYRAGN